MKNVTIALDDEVHRRARIRAAELGTSLSALVKDYLNGLAAGGERMPKGFREMPMPYKHAEAAKASPPWLSKSKPRQPGGLRKSGNTGDLHETPDWLIDIMEGSEDDFSDLLPFDESQLPR